MFELPENLAALSAEELQALIDQGLDALRALGVTADSDEETIAEGERIVAADQRRARAEQTRVEEAEADAPDRAAGAASTRPTPEPSPTTPDDPEPEPEPEPAEARRRSSPPTR